MTDLASEMDSFLKAGTAGSLWAAAEVLILLFGPLGIWPTLSVSLFLHSYIFSSVFNFTSFSNHFIKHLSLAFSAVASVSEQLSRLEQRYFLTLHVCALITQMCVKLQATR